MQEQEHEKDSAEPRASGQPPRELPRGPSSPPAAGGVRFATQEERDGETLQLERTGLVVVELEGIGPSLQGRLGEAIDSAIERALAALGASGPGITAGHERDSTLSDQLFRARRLGKRGLAIVLGPLSAATSWRSAIGPEDSATLRFLAQATAERPLILLLDATDASTGSYGDPVPLQSLLLAHSHRREKAYDAASEAHESSCEPVEAPALSCAPPVAVDKPVAVESAVLEEKGGAWRAWTLQLTAARGPQPLAVLEKLFTESYTPLANALACGLDDARARHAHDEFGATFAKGYMDAFPTLSATAKRPRMVFDMHDIAARIGRLHGARSTRVLVVDAMRWDVSRMIEERVVARLGSQASLTEELVLWSALPTTTPRQLETIARGVEALRSPAAVDVEGEPPRGRTAEYVRRMRVGPREIHKLDVVEARVQSARGTVLHDLPEIAEAAGEAIARHAETCPPRTLLLVTGDHGFALDRDGSARQGGASPEEVLVGAFALLIGDVH
jgi:hypothetical protein